MLKNIFNNSYGITQSILISTISTQSIKRLQELFNTVKKTWGIATK